MAILKTVYGKTGSTSFEPVDGILKTDDRTIRLYHTTGVQERELSPGDFVELIEDPKIISI